MKTIIEKIENIKTDHQIIRRAGEILFSGGTVAFPTETVYGLGANALDPSSIKKIFKAKGRPSDNPLIVHIADLADIDSLVSKIPPIAKTLMEHFWPGALTLIFSKSSKVPYEITGGLDTVAIRFPVHPIAQEIIKAAGVPIAAPSANLSGKPSPTKAAHVIEDLKGKVDMIVDGGAASIGLESTVLDITGKIPMILRPGGVTKEMLETVVGPILMDPALSQGQEQDFIPKAPGMKYKHYAPVAEVKVVMGEINAVTEKIQELTKKNKGNLKIGIMATDQTRSSYDEINALVISVGDRLHPETIANHLFDALRWFDEQKVDLIYAEGIQEVQMGIAIMNRLIKAAGYQTIFAESKGGENK